MARKGDRASDPLFVVGGNGGTAGAQETTLQDVKTLLQQIEDNTDQLEAKLDTLTGKDYSTQATLEAARVLLASLDGKLPAATALGDGDANPTTTRIGAHLMAWNGSTVWSRLINSQPADAASLASRRLLTSSLPHLSNGATLDVLRSVAALNGSTTAGTLPNVHSAGTGIPVTAMLGHDPTTGAVAYRMPTVRVPGDGAGASPAAFHTFAQLALIDAGGANVNRARGNIADGLLVDAGRRPQDRTGRVWKSVGIQNVSASQVVYTVTAGKKFHSLGGYIVARNTSTASVATFEVRDNGAAGTVILTDTLPLAVATLTDPNHVFPLGPGLEFDVDVYFKSLMGTPVVDIRMWGYEE